MSRPLAALASRHLIAAVGTFLIGCAVLLLAVGCAGTRSETSKKEQGSSPKATDSEKVRCEGTRTIKVTWLQRFPDAGPIKQSVFFTTNDLPGCPNKGGLHSGTDKPDKLNGFDGDDEIRGLAGPDFIVGGAGNDVIYAGPGDDKGKGKYYDRDVMGNRGDDVLYGGDGNDELGSEMGQDEGEDVYYGGDGNDVLGGETRRQGSGEDVYYGEGGNDFISASGDRQPDKLYCGKGKDRYIAVANASASASASASPGHTGSASASVTTTPAPTPSEKIDYVDSSCEKKMLAPVP